MRSKAAPVVVLLLLVGGGLLGGCGSAPEEIDPTGVDQVSSSITDPDPRDFVDVVDNRWFPLAPGTTWTYRVSGDPRARTRTTTVADRTREIAGVATTVVRTVTRGARGRHTVETVAFYAQDRDGNVWLFGTAGDTADPWQVGVSDARATLAMAAEPRHGDGYATAYVGGEATQTAEVLVTDASASTPYGDFDDVVEVEVVTPGRSGGAVVLAYAPGVGLVEQESIGSVELDLVDVTH